MDNKGVTVWALHGLEKVFADTFPPANASAVIELAGAAGECEVAQIAVHSPDEPIVLHRPRIRALRAGDGEIDSQNVSARFVELVPVRYATQGIPDDDIVRAAPGYFPDPLCVDDSMIVPAGQTRSIWLCFGIPEDAAPGDYESTVTVVASGGGEAEISVKFTVWPFALPRHTRFDSTHWIWPDVIAKYHCVKLYSDAFFDILEVYADDMAAHRQNTILTHIVGGEGIIGITRTAEGAYTFDFAEFDRWVDVFFSRGFRYIEGSHVFDNSVRFVRVTDAATGELQTIDKLSNKDGIVEGDEYMTIMPLLVAALRDHVRERGWAERYIQHIFDEPSGMQMSTYRLVAGMVRETWPEVRLLDATAVNRELFDVIDILVPLVGARLSYAELEKYRGTDKTFWSYTCNWPRGRFPNRYLDQKLIQTRIMPWVFWRHGITGYLHWAYARWSPHHTHGRIDFDAHSGESQPALQLINPWSDVVLGASWSCPAGDAWMVYPPRDALSQDPEILRPGFGRFIADIVNGMPIPEQGAGDPADDGPDDALAGGVVDSIRWEQMREGIEDYDLLCLLRDQIDRVRGIDVSAAEDAENALNAVIERVAPDWENYTRDAAEIDRARAELAAQITTLMKVSDR